MLVFSAWSEVLELLAHSLDSHGVRYLSGKDKASLHKALDAFDTSRAEAKEAVEVRGGATIRRPRGLAGRKKRPRADDGGGEPRVLLLQLKQAAAGLNLVQAQHVLLIEPSTDPAVEAQVRPASSCLLAPPDIAAVHTQHALLPARLVLLQLTSGLFASAPLLLGWHRPYPHGPAGCDGASFANTRSCKMIAKSCGEVQRSSIRVATVFMDAAHQCFPSYLVAGWFCTQVCVHCAPVSVNLYCRPPPATAVDARWRACSSGLL